MAISDEVERGVMARRARGAAPAAEPRAAPRQMPTDARPIYVLNGPNLNLLGEREPEIYGRQSLDDIRNLCVAKAATHGHSVVFRQSNHEGELIDWVQEARTDASALIIHPAGYGHPSVAL